MNMKKLITILFLLISLIGFSQHHMMHTLAGQGGANTTLKIDLISIWEMDETSGTTMFDSHGSNDGEISATVTINQTGIINKSYYFDATDDRIIVPHSSTLSPSGDMSFAAWVKGTTVDGAFIVIMNKDAVTSNRQFTFAIDNYKYPRLYFFSSSGYSGRLSNTKVMDGNWYYIVATYTASNGLINFYVNGSLANGTQDATTSGGMNSGTADMWVGYRSYGSATRMYGNYDQLAIWNKLLSTDEISLLYNSGNGLPYSEW